LQTLAVLVNPTFNPAIVAKGIESLETPASLEIFSYDEEAVLVSIADCELSSFVGIGEAEFE